MEKKAREMAKEAEVEYRNKQRCIKHVDRLMKECNSDYTTAAR